MESTIRSNVSSQSFDTSAVKRQDGMAVLDADVDHFDVHRVANRSTCERDRYCHPQTALP